MKKIIIFLFFVFLNAQIIDKCLVVKGVGTSRNEAIKNALILAVSEYKGISVKQIEFLQNKIANISINNKSDSYLEHKYINQISTSTNGFIKSFRILSVNRTDNGFEAVLKVCFNAYKLSGYSPNNRKSIAVFPFINDENFVFTNLLLDYLTQIRKFNVIDRSDSKYLDIENAFWLRPTTDKNEIVKLGKRIGSDYILCGKINVKENITKEKLPLLDKYQIKKTYVVLVDYKIFDSVTGIVKWANSIEVSAKNLDDAYRLAAKKLIEEIVYNVYPPRVINVEDNFITVDYGSGLMKKGEVFYIYSDGKKLYDTYTKEFIGYDEKRVGIAKIIRTTPKFSVAIYKGEVKKGDILRKVKR